MTDRDSTLLPLTAMDAALLRDLVGKVDNRIDGRALLSVADSIDAVLAAVEEERYEHEEALRQQYAAGFIEARGWRPNPDSMGHWVDPIDGSRFNGYRTALDRERHRTEQSEDSPPHWKKCGLGKDCHSPIHNMAGCPNPEICYAVVGNIEAMKRMEAMKRTEQAQSEDSPPERLELMCGCSFGEDEPIVHRCQGRTEQANREAP